MKAATPAVHSADLLETLWVAWMVLQLVESRVALMAVELVLRVAAYLVGVKAVRWGNEKVEPMDA